MTVVGRLSARTGATTGSSGLTARLIRVSVTVTIVTIFLAVRIINTSSEVAYNDFVFSY